MKYKVSSLSKSQKSEGTGNREQGTGNREQWNPPFTLLRVRLKTWTCRVLY